MFPLSDRTSSCCDSKSKQWVRALHILRAVATTSLSFSLILTKLPAIEKNKQTNSIHQTSENVFLTSISKWINSFGQESLISNPPLSLILHYIIVAFDIADAKSVKGACHIKGVAEIFQRGLGSRGHGYEFSGALHAAAFTASCHACCDGCTTWLISCVSHL